MEPEEWYIHVERMGYYEDLRITENDAFRFSRPCGRNHIYRGCNFRCPFCHNSDLLGSDAPAAFTDEEVLDFLKKRRGILEGAAITGGEPTLQAGSGGFHSEGSGAGIPDQAGYQRLPPEVLKRLCEKGLVDYVAMDIKAW